MSLVIFHSNNNSNWYLSIPSFYRLFPVGWPVVPNLLIPALSQILLQKYWPTLIEQLSKMNPYSMPLLPYDHMHPAIIDTDHVPHLETFKQNHPRSKIMIFRLILESRSALWSQSTWNNLPVLQSNSGVFAFLLGVHCGQIVEVCRFGIKRAEGTFGVKLIKLNELPVKAEVGILFTTEHAADFNLSSGLPRTTVFQNLNKP